MGQIVELLRERSLRARDDVDTFLDAVAFNWIIAGTDAHAKNYSVLHARGGAVRLAPLYDLASFLPYAGHGLRKLTLAMKIGGTYRLHDVGAHEWTKLAREVGRDPEALRARVAEMCRAIPDHAARLLATAREDGLTHPVLSELVASISERARACARALTLT